MRVFDAGAREGSQRVQERVLTLPNGLSLVRLLALPWIFADITAGRHLRALVVAGLVASTDWLDGYLARRLDQVSRLGQLLDPLTDRLLVATIGIGLVVTDLVPLWALLVVVLRDAVLLAGAGALVMRGVRPPAVTRAGKAATFALLLSLPAFLLASVVATPGREQLGEAVRAGAWVAYGVGVVLSYAAGSSYARAAMRTLRAG